MIAPWFRFRNPNDSWLLSVAASFPATSTINPPKYASSSLPGELDAASGFEFLLALASGFPADALSIPGLFDAIRWFTDEELVETIHVKFIAVGFDFATVLSSSFCSCILFAIVLKQQVMLKFWAQQRELKWLMLNKCRRWFHSSRVKLSLVSMSANWCLVSKYLMRILGSRLITSTHQTTNPEQLMLSTFFRSRLACLVGFGFFFFMWSVVFRDRFSCDSWSLDLLIWFGEERNTNVTKSTEVCFSHIQLIGTNVWLPKMHYDSDSCFQELRRSDPIYREQVIHPTSILHPKKWFLILLNCAKLKFVSCTSNSLEQMYDFHKCTMFHLMLISSLQGLLQKSLETILICIVVLYVHVTILFEFTCDECKRSNAPNVGHIRHVWNFPWSVCLRVGFWCRCIWFGFWNPD